MRRGLPGDVEAIEQIQHRAWLHAYEFLGPRLAEYDPGERARRIALRLDEPGAETWVAELEQALAGFVALGAGDDADSSPCCGRLAALYVDPIAHGAGVGSRLHALALERLHSHGFTHATLWTFEQNEAARHYYARRGWADDAGGSAQQRPQWLAPAVRMRIDLGG